MSRVSARSAAFVTPWFTLQELLVDGGGSPYYAVHTLDYVSVFAVSEHGNVILVRQFRPAVDDTVLELPGGHVEIGEAPEDAARRELLEETGYHAETIEFLGRLVPDSGRLANRQWCYFASSATRVSAGGEDGVDVIEMTPTSFNDALCDGTFQHALHVAVVMMAVIKGRWTPPSTSPR